MHRRARRLLTLVASVLLATWVSAACSPPAVSPQLIIDDSVAGDFAALATTTWDGFMDVFAARGGCFGNVHLRAVRSLNSRAAYDPPTATVTVRVPGTAALLQSALIHEWAHHVEFQCPAHAELRPDFLAALGLPAGTVWRPDGELAGMGGDSPSERYAEAAVALVLGRRPIPTRDRVSQAAVDTLARWAAGD